VVNLQTNRCVRIIGKVENTERFLRIALYQGGEKKGSKAYRANLSANSQNPAPITITNPDGSVTTTTDPSQLGRDVTLLCCAFKKQRLYLFSKREPEEAEEASKGRDVFNEKPPAEELLALTDSGRAAAGQLATGVVSPAAIL
jgi:peptidylprolyl isomerase domain and WD repeat-containing protein 1